MSVSPAPSHCSIHPPRGQAREPLSKAQILWLPFKALQLLDLTLRATWRNLKLNPEGLYDLSPTHPVPQRALMFLPFHVSNMSVFFHFTNSNMLCHLEILVFFPTHVNAVQHRSQGVFLGSLLNILGLPATSSKESCTWTPSHRMNGALSRLSTIMSSAARAALEHTHAFKEP